MHQDHTLTIEKGQGPLRAVVAIGLETRPHALHSVRDIDDALVAQFFRLGLIRYGQIISPDMNDSDSNPNTHTRRTGWAGF